MKRKKEALRYVCERCNVRFDSDEALRRHDVEAHGAGSRPFVCSSCSTTFESHRAFREHFVRAHGELPPTERKRVGATRGQQKSPKKNAPKSKKRKDTH